APLSLGDDRHGPPGRAEAELRLPRRIGALGLEGLDLVEVLEQLELRLLLVELPVAQEPLVVVPDLLLLEAKDLLVALLHDEGRCVISLEREQLLALLEASTDSLEEVGVHLADHAARGLHDEDRGAVAPPEEERLL